jgi:hypothetical protein
VLLKKKLKYFYKIQYKVLIIKSNFKSFKYITMSQINNSDIKMSANQPVLCIPGVFANIKEERIRRVFGDLDLGDVTRVDIVVPKIQVDAGGKENKFNRVFIHLNWSESEESIACRQRLSQGKDIKIIYDEPWFWRVSAYRPPAPKRTFQPIPKVFKPKKATLELDFESEIKYSGVIAQGLSIIIPDEINYSGVIAQGLSIIIPDEINYSGVIAQGLSVTIPDEIKIKSPLEPKSPNCPPPTQKKQAKQYNELGAEIEELVLDYGKAEAPRRKKTVIKVEDTKIVAEK